MDNDVVDVRQRFEREEKHVPHEIVAPSVVASSLFDFDPPDSINNDTWLRGSPEHEAP